MPMKAVHRSKGLQKWVSKEKRVGTNKDRIRAKIQDLDLEYFEIEANLGKWIKELRIHAMCMYFFDRAVNNAVYSLDSWYKIPFKQSTIIREADSESIEQLKPCVFFTAPSRGYNPRTPYNIPDRKPICVWKATIENTSRYFLYAGMKCKLDKRQSEAYIEYPAFDQLLDLLNIKDKTYEFILDPKTRFGKKRAIKIGKEIKDIENVVHDTTIELLPRGCDVDKLPEEPITRLKSIKELIAKYEYIWTGYNPECLVTKHVKEDGTTINDHSDFDYIYTLASNLEDKFLRPIPHWDVTKTEQVSNECVYDILLKFI